MLPDCTYASFNIKDEDENKNNDSSTEDNDNKDNNNKKNNNKIYPPTWCRRSKESGEARTPHLISMSSNDEDDNEDRSTEDNDNKDNGNEKNNDNYLYKGVFCGMWAP